MLMRRWLSQPTTVIERAAWTLRSMILRGGLCPGERLVEAQLCQRLDVSRASLREALRILESECLVTLSPNRGYSIAEISLEEIGEIHEVWALLTGEGVYRFTGLARAADITRLRALVDMLEDCDWKSPEALDRINEFFAIILERCGNKILQDSVWHLVSRINFVRSLSQDPRVCKIWVAELRAVVDAIAMGDPEAARQAVDRHIASACTQAQRAIRETESRRSLEQRTELPA